MTDTPTKTRKAPTFVDLPTQFTVKTSKVAPERAAGHGRGASEAYTALATIVAGALDGKPRQLEGLEGEAVQESVARHMRRAAAENHNRAMKFQPTHKRPVNNRSDLLIFQVLDEPPTVRPRKPAAG